MLGPLSCIVGHIHSHLTFTQPAKGGSTHVSTLLIKYPVVDAHSIIAPTLVFVRVCMCVCVIGVAGGD